MAFFDLNHDELKRYVPTSSEPTDFDAFWLEALKQLHLKPLNVEWTRLDTGFQWLDSYDVTFSGYGGQPIKAWFNVPKNRPSKVPCVIEYIGYGGGRGFASDWLIWPSLGYAHFIMDTRGQGSEWSPGATPDIEDAKASQGQVAGFMTRGILNPMTYYYHRVFCDAVRAVEAASSFPDVDATRLAVTGGSQGGGISIAAASLAPQVAVVMPDVPFLCNFRRATEITAAFPYQEIAKYLAVHRDQVETVFKTLAYFDGMNFSARCKARALYSVGLMDEVCPPSTVFSAYNRHQGPKEICVWEYNHHEGGASFQAQRKMQFLRQLWSA